MNKEESVYLTLKESELMNALVVSKSKHSFLSHQQLIQFVWMGKEQCINNGNVVQLIFLLRKKLLLISREVRIINLFKRGYYLDGDEEIVLTSHPLHFCSLTELSE
ncbi:winged helix-turn-helix domain-containing protein [Salmonella enterica]|nr:winged helix-turn-helix domain-containing protein [Salmonella enterica]EJR3519427.1 winged helix-turn-helix domain-containing protein [Salmonella enterica]